MTKPEKSQKNEAEPLHYQEISIKLSTLLDALPHPARIQILLHLSEHENCPAGNISDRLPLCKSTVSQHLAKLKEVGLINCTTEGVCLNYRIHDGNISQIKTVFLDFFQNIEGLKGKRKECISSFKNIKKLN